MIRDDKQYVITQRLRNLFDAELKYLDEKFDTLVSDEEKQISNLRHASLEGVIYILDQEIAEYEAK